MTPDGCQLYTVLLARNRTDRGIVRSGTIDGTGTRRLAYILVAYNLSVGFLCTRRCSGTVRCGCSRSCKQHCVHTECIGMGRCSSCSRRLPLPGSPNQTDIRFRSKRSGHFRCSLRGTYKWHGGTVLDIRRLDCTDRCWPCTDSRTVG